MISVVSSFWFAVLCRMVRRCGLRRGKRSVAAARIVIDLLFVCMIILVIFRCVVRSFFFISSFTVHVLEAWGSDGVTVALSGYFGDVSSCLWLVNVAHAHLMRWPNSTWTAFLKVMSWPRCLTFLSWWQDLDSLFCEPLPRCFSCSLGAVAGCALLWLW